MREYVQFEEEIYNLFGCDCLLTYCEIQTDSGGSEEESSSGKIPILGKYTLVIYAELWIFLSSEG